MHGGVGMSARFALLVPRSRYVPQPERTFPATFIVCLPIGSSHGLDRQSPVRSPLSLAPSKDTDVATLSSSPYLGASASESLGVQNLHNGMVGD